MAKQLLLISHGPFSQALKQSTEMIMGPQEGIHTVCLLPEEGPEDFEAKLVATLEQLDDVIVLADLMGGTPCNVAAKLLMQDYSFDLFAGMNMPMVIGFINASLIGDSIDLKTFGAENIHKVNEMLTVVDDEDDLI